MVLPHVKIQSTTYYFRYTISRRKTENPSYPWYFWGNGRAQNPDTGVLRVFLQLTVRLETGGEELCPCGCHNSAYPSYLERGIPGKIHGTIVLLW